MPYTIFESANMKSIHYAERMRDAVCTSDTENGTIGYIPIVPNGDYYDFTPGLSDKAEFAKIVLADNPPYDEEGVLLEAQRRSEYIIFANDKFRIRAVAVDDELKYSIDGFTAATQNLVKDTDDFYADPVYAYVDDTTGKLVASETAPSGEEFAGQITGKQMLAGSKGKVVMYCVKVVIAGAGLSASGGSDGDFLRLVDGKPTWTTVPEAENEGV